MKKGNELNEHDITKTMLYKIRDINKGLLKEESNDTIELTGADRKAEEDKFADIVTQRVKFDKFFIYPYANNVTFSGVFDGGIKWEMSKNDGLYFDANNVQMDDATQEILDLLKKYYENWVDEWSSKLRTDYKVKEQ